MSDLELSHLVERMDQLVPRDGAKLRIPVDADGTPTLGTLAGYRRLGIELLRAAGAFVPPAGEEPARLPLDIQYLLIGDEASPLELCEVDPRIEERSVPERRKLDALGQLLAAAVVVLLLVLVLVGASAVLGWVLG